MGELFTFEDILFTMVFLCTVWASGRACEQIGMPGLIGEIVVGAILGPELVNFVPQPIAFEMVGEIG